MPTHVADRLTRDERIQIYQWAGEGYSMREICQMFNRPRGPLPKIRIPGVEKILNMPEAHRFVAKFRIEFLKNVKDIPVSQKVVRLDDLESLRQRLMHIINNCHPNRSEREVSRLLTVSKRVIEIIDLARNEMEQRPGVSIGIGVNQGDMVELTDEQLKSIRDELMRKASRLIERRASSVDEGAEGDESEDQGRSSEVLLATSEELRRSELPKGDFDLFDLRQQKADDKGLPSV